MDNSLKTINDIIEYVNTTCFTNIPLDTNVLGIKARLLDYLDSKQTDIVNNSVDEKRTNNM